MPQNSKILVIDDSPFIFKAVKKAVEPFGHQMLDQAFNGQEGLARIEECNPDIIILDVTMPIMDGIETAKRLFSKNPNANVIMLSAMGDDELIKSAMAIGVQQFLSKPFTPDDLLNAINNISAKEGL